VSSGYLGLQVDVSTASMSEGPSGWARVCRLSLPPGAATIPRCFSICPSHELQVRSVNPPP
jgi:hypothetical protein